MPFDVNQVSLAELGHLIAEAPKNVVFVIGAGLSRPAGIPDWNGLCQRLQQAVEQYYLDDHTLAVADRMIRLERLQEFRDPWFLGDEYARILPPKKYEAVIQSALTANSVPKTFTALWNLTPSGVISFNLDFLAQQALSPLPEQVATPFEEGRFQRFLLLQKPFLLQPHGRLDTPSSWVLGAQRRNHLLHSHSYRRFMSSVLSSRRLVIVGFGPKDIAFQSLLLDDFRDSMSQGVGHFWITSTLSPEDRQWAQLYNIAPIEYEPATPEHDEVHEILQILRTFTPRTLSAPLAYDGPTISPDELPDDDELRQQPVEGIRQRLNAALKGAVESAPTDHETQMDAIKKLFNSYSGSVHMAWHVRPDSQYGQVWGYKILSRLGDGAFANVWKVLDVVDGRTYAMKLMHEQVVGESHMYEAFRRGVNASRILNERRVQGMVPFEAAFDVPATVVMEYVEGLTLRDAVNANLFETISDALDTVRRVAEIVHAGHQLNERVLHRDLQPNNVMLRYATEMVPDRDVVVLDFDLSWYEGALGRSVLPGARLHNYLAPEQISASGKQYSSRHTAVDVFGIGMLLYFVATGKDPDLNVQNTTGFKQRTLDQITAKWNTKFSASPSSIFNLIEFSTLNNQPARLSLPNLIEGIMLISKCERDGRLPVPSDLAVMQFGQSFPSDIWNIENQSANSGRFRCKSTVSGGSAEISAAPGTKGGLSINLAYSSSGESQRSNVAKYLQSRVDRTTSRLRAHSEFRDIRSNVQYGSASVTMRVISGNFTQEQAKRLCEALAEAAGTMSFENA